MTIIEKELSSLTPSQEALLEIPPENWFSNEDLCTQDDDVNNVNHVKNKTEAVLALEESQGKLVSLLTTECAHLIRKSDSVLKKL